MDTVVSSTQTRARAVFGSNEQGMICKRNSLRHPFSLGPWLVYVILAGSFNVGLMWAHWFRKSHAEGTVPSYVLLLLKNLSSS